MHGGGTGAAALGGETELRVECNSVESVVQGLAKLLCNREEAEKMGQRGWSRAQTEFAWERVAEKTLALSLKMTP